MYHNPDTQRPFRVAIMHAGAPAAGMLLHLRLPASQPPNFSPFYRALSFPELPGMNNAVKTVVRLLVASGHSVFGATNGFEGFVPVISCPPCQVVPNLTRALCLARVSCRLIAALRGVMYSRWSGAVWRAGLRLAAPALERAALFQVREAFDSIPLFMFAPLANLGV